MEDCCAPCVKEDPNVNKKNKNKSRTRSLSRAQCFINRNAGNSFPSATAQHKLHKQRILLPRQGASRGLEEPWKIILVNRKE